MAKISYKNYLYLLLVVIVTVALVYYMYLWFIEYDKNKDYKSVLMDVMQVVNYNEFDTYLVENKDAIIYASITNDSKIRQFDKKFKRLIGDNNIGNKILYLDLTGNKKLDLINSNVIIPAIMVYKNGNMIDSYSVKTDGYSIHNLEEYLVSIGVIKND